MRLPLLHASWAITFCFLTGLWLCAQPAQKGLSRLGGLDWPTSLNDVWGYADSSGHEYALVGTGQGPSIVDLSDPANPQELFWFQRPYSLWWDMKTYGDFAYASNETGGGLMIIDMRELPTNAIAKDSVFEGITTIHNLWVDEDGYLYLCGGNKTGGMLILDLNPDPWHPSVVGSYNEGYVHDVYVRNDTAYSAELQGGLTLVDLNDRQAPFSFNNRNYPGSLTHNTWLSDDGNTCFTTDEVFAGEIISWDVSNPNNVVELDRYRSQRDGTSIPHNVHVKDNFLVISHYREGVVIVDITHPEYMVEVGYYDTSPLSGGNYDGCWGAYPFLPSGLILSTDVIEGFDVLAPSYRGAAFVEGVVADINTGLPLTGVKVNLVGQDSLLTDADGHFLLGVADSGAYDLAFDLPGYLPKQSALDLHHDSTLNDTFYLVSFPKGQVTYELVSAKDNSPLNQGRIESQVSIGTDTLYYGSLTDPQGKWAAIEVLNGAHHVVAGKWGYRSLDTTIVVSNSPQTVRLALEPGYADDFALDLGWQVSSNALFGDWVRAEPVGTNLALGSGFPAAPAADVADDLGRLAFVTGNATGPQAAEDHDLDGGQTMLISPGMDLRTYQRPRLRLRWWLTNSNNPDMSALAQGSGNLAIRLLAGGTTYPLFQSDTIQSGGWLLLETDTLPRINPAQLIITATAGLEADILEAGIDHLEIFEGDSITKSPGTLEEDPLRLWVAGTDEATLTLAYHLPSPVGARWQVDVVDLTGRQLAQHVLPSGQSLLTIPFQQPAGIYFLQLRRAGSVVQVQRVLWP
jgi:choice-of-anchor B domain-containing protein